VREENQRRLLIAFAGGGENLIPGILRVGEHGRDELTAIVAGRSDLSRLGRRLRADLDRTTATAEPAKDLQRVDAKGPGKNEKDDDRPDAEAAATAATSPAGGKA